MTPEVRPPRSRHKRQYSCHRALSLSVWGVHPWISALLVRNHRPHRKATWSVPGDIDKQERERGRLWDDSSYRLSARHCNLLINSYLTWEIPSKNHLSSPDLWSMRNNNKMIIVLSHWQCGDSSCRICTWTRFWYLWVGCCHTKAHIGSRQWEGYRGAQVDWELKPGTLNDAVGKALQENKKNAIGSWMEGDICYAAIESLSYCYS